jgi:hypothetical protein
VKLTLTIFAFLTFSNVYCQDKCPAIINWKYLGTVDIYNKPGGEIIATMKNDSINEDFLHLDILDQTETYFRVSIGSTIKPQNINKGWIRKANYIGALIKHEKDPMDLELFQFKKNSSSDKIVISNWTPGLLTIEKFADKWAFVSTRQNGQTYKGWIEIDKLCANAYTTCN